MWSSLAKADKAFRDWAARPFSERSKIIGRAAQILLEQKEELARLATLEMGKRIAESRGEVELSASIMKYFADKAEGFLAPKKLDSAMGDARLEYSPFGVLKSMLDKFLPRFIAAAKKLKLGDPLDETVILGPLSSDAALQLTLRQIQEATSHGAQIALGGGRAGKVGAFLEPTILTNVTSDNPAYRQEFFGPVALVFPAKDEDEAIAIANDSPFGLGGSVYTSDINRGKRVASRIETGMVFINYPDVSAPDLPFGGIKRSGYGKELSSLEIEEFVNKKLILVPNSPHKE